MFEIEGDGAFVREQFAPGRDLEDSHDLLEHPLRLRPFCIGEFRRRKLENVIEGPGREELLQGALVGLHQPRAGIRVVPVRIEVNIFGNILPEGETVAVNMIRVVYPPDYIWTTFRPTTTGALAINSIS